MNHILLTPSFILHVSHCLLSYAGCASLVFFSSSQATIVLALVED